MTPALHDPKKARGWIHGRAVVDGVPRFFSASSVDRADRCLRAWHYEKIAGKKPPESKSQERGTRLHLEVANYLRTGQKHMGATAMRGLHFVPEPGPDLLIERDLLLYPWEVALTPKQAKAYADRGEVLPPNYVVPSVGRPVLTLEDVPFLGDLDCAHRRGTNKGAERDGPDDEIVVGDPPGTVEVLDWKNAGDDRFLKAGSDLVHTIQMASYGEWVWRVAPDAPFVRLSHGYFVEKGRSRKATALVDREATRRTWEHAGGVARSIKHAAVELNTDKVDANLSACNDYGGCAHRTYCKAHMQQSLAAYVGQTAATRVLSTWAGDALASRSTPFEGIIAAAQVATAPAPQPDQGLIAPMSLLKKTATAPTIDLAAVKDQYEKIKYLGQATGLGLPVFAGNLAQAIGQACGFAVTPGAALAGTAPLNQYTFGEVAQLAGVLGQLVAQAGQRSIAIPWAANVAPPASLAPVMEPAPAPPTPDQVIATQQAQAAQVFVPPNGTPQYQAAMAAAFPAAPAISPLPPDAPASDPALAAVPVEGWGTPAAAPTVAATLPPALAPAAAPAPATPPPAAVTEGKGKKGKPKTEAPSSTAISIYVNCIPGGTFTNLAPWIAECMSGLGSLFEAQDQRFSNDDGTAVDPRLAASNTPVAFGRWRAAVGAIIAEAPLAPGKYVLISRDDVVESCMGALQRKAEASGGELVQGVR